MKKLHKHICSVRLKKETWARTLPYNALGPFSSPAYLPSILVCESHNFPQVSLLSPRLMDQQIVISTLYHPSLPNVQWRLSIVTHCNLWLFIYPCILFTSTKHLRTNILTSGSVFPLYPSLRYTYIAHCFWQWFKNQISEIRF